MNEKLKELVFSYLDTVTEGSNLYSTTKSISLWLANPETGKWYASRMMNDATFDQDTINDIALFFNMDKTIVISLIEEWLGILLPPVVGVSDFNNAGNLVQDKIEISRMKLVKKLGESRINEEVIDEDRLKTLIYKYLDTITEGANLYQYYGEKNKYSIDTVLLINPKTYYWYFELNEKGSVWVREEIVEEMSMMFNIKTDMVSQYAFTWFKHVLKQSIVDDPNFGWVKEILGLYKLKLWTSSDEQERKIKKFLNESIDNNEKLKELIFDYLDFRIKGIKLYKDNTYYWFIDIRNENWDYYLTTTKILFINKNVVREIFDLYRVDIFDSSELIKAWFEKTFNIEVKYTELESHKFRGILDNLMNDGELIGILGNDENSINESFEEDGIRKLIFLYLDTITKGSKLYRSHTGALRLINPETKTYYCGIGGDGEGWVNRGLLDELNALYNEGFNYLLTTVGKWFGNILGDITFVSVRLVHMGQEEVDHFINGGEIVKELGTGSINEDFNEQKLRYIIYDYLDLITKGFKLYDHSSKVSRYLWLINNQIPYSVYNYYNNKISVSTKLIEEIASVFSINPIKAKIIIGMWFSKICDVHPDGVDEITHHYREYLPSITRTKNIVKTLGESVEINEEFKEQSIWSNKKLQKIVFEYLDLVSEGYAIYQENTHYKNKDTFLVNIKDRTWIWCLTRHKNLIINGNLVREIQNIFGIQSKYDCSSLIRLWNEKIFNTNYNSLENQSISFKRTIEDIIAGKYVKVKSLDGDSINEETEKHEDKLPKN